MTAQAAAARARNRRGEGESLRLEIVAAALTAVRGGGTRETITLRALARQIGIAPTSIYAHFAAVDDILKEAALAGYAELAAVLRAAAGAADPVTRLAEIVVAYLDFAAAQPSLYRLLFGTPLKGTGEPLDGTAGGEAFGVLLEVMGACIETGRSGHRDVLLAATLTWMALHGLATLPGTHPDFPWPGRNVLVAGLIAHVADVRISR